MSIIKNKEEIRKEAKEAAKHFDGKPINIRISGPTGAGKDAVKRIIEQAFNHGIVNRPDLELDRLTCFHRNIDGNINIIEETPEYRGAGLIKPQEPVKPQFNLPAPVRIGVLRTKAAVFKAPDGSETAEWQTYADGQWVKNEVLSHTTHNQWTDTGTVGLLINFFTESCDDGQIVVGLVELPSGQFETFSASCLKLVTPNTY